MRLFFLPALLCALALFWGCAGSSQDSLPDLRLPTLSARLGASLASCPTAKCLTIYVAPWCGYCRAGTPLILALRRHLKERGVATRVVVGMSGLEEIEAYAREFGPDTLLDPEGSYRVAGVPHFIVSNQKGAILRDVAGMPFAIENVADFASYYGLP